MYKRIRLFSYFLIFCFITTLNSCRKDEYFIRVRNDYSNAIGISVAGLSIPHIDPGVNTEYESVATGSFHIGVLDVSGAGTATSGNIIVDGEGMNKWTIIITSGFTIDIHKD